MIEKILRFSLRHPVVVIVFAIVVGSYGFYSFTKLPIDAVPDITNNQVQINTLLPGFSPSQIEKQVTYVIETALAGIPGMQMTRSISRNAFSQVTAIFDDDVSIYFARQQINERLNEIKDDLPEGAEPKMGAISTGLGEVYMWTVDFKQPQEKGLNEIENAAYLRTVQDWIVKPQLKGVQGVAGIDSIGGYLKQYHIEPNIEKMLALGLSFDDILSAIKKNNVSIGPGYIEKRGESLLIKSDEKLDAQTQLEMLVVATRDGIPIAIKEIADVTIGKEMRTGSATKNGHEAVIGTALMLIGANSRTVAQAVDSKIQEINSGLPPEIEVKPLLNRTKLVNATITTISKNLSEGAILVIAILFLFLGQFRAAFITALVIPFSMLMTATGMVHSKVSGNLMSLGAIDFGLIVDGAVIITENCLRRLALKQNELGRNLEFKERIDEYLIATKEMIKPTVFGQAIIIIVYIPILTLSGVEGKMFHPMAITVILALISAFVLSLTFVPAMIAVFVKGGKNMKESKIIDYSKRIYKPVLENCLNWPKLTVGLGSGVFLFSLLIFTALGQEFVPTLDEKDIAMHAIRIASTSLTQSTEMQKKVEKALKQFPEVDYVFSKTGTAEMATDPMPPNISDTFIILKPQEEWPDKKLAKAALIEKIEHSLMHLPGNNYEFTQPIEMRFNELISGIRSDLAVKIYGDDFNAMHKVAEQVESVLSKIKGSADVKVAQTTGLPVLDVKIDREAASRLGINVSDALDVLAVATGGGKAGQLFEGDKRFDVIVRLPEAQRTDLVSLSNLPIPLTLSGKSGSYPHVPLGEIATLKITDGLNEVRRENGKRFIAVQSNIRNRDLGSYVTEAKHTIREKVSIPEGSWIEWGGQFENLMSARKTFMIVIPICLGLIFLLLYTAFNSLRNAFLVFSGVPLALTGGIFALFMRDMSFSISAAVGFIALSGIAVLNGLVLITFINQLFNETGDLETSIHEGCLTRLRPVLMTALVASLGFVPMALATGTGAEVQKPLATVVIGGLISSTLLTLMILPALYKLFSRPCRINS